MTRKNKIFIAAIIFLIIVVLAILIMWFLNRPSTDVSQGNVNNNGSLDLSGVLPTNPDLLDDIVDMPAEMQNLEADLKAISKTFAERYGSYSTQGNFSNLESLRTLMTLKMKATTDSFISSQPTDEEQIYYGVTTKAVSIDVQLIDEEIGRAELLVSTQRQEAKFDTSNPRTFYQDLLLKLAKDGDSWKVDSATWQ